MAQIKFTVSGERLDLVTPTQLLAGSLNTTSMIFDFRSKDWEGAEKWVHLSCPDFNDGANYHFAIINDEVGTDSGLNLPSGIWDVYVTGVVSDINGDVVRRLITDKQSIVVDNTDLEDNGPFPNVDIELSVVEALDSKISSVIQGGVVAATATVDSRVGIPAVDVVVTGVAGKKTIAFDFHNLKGKGIDSVVFAPNGHLTVFLDDDSKAEYDGIETVMSDEEDRKNAETLRVNAETERSEAETTRQQNETTRQQNETARQQNESTRQQNESTRQQNETTRGSNENTRQQNETARAQAEQARVRAEEERVEEYDGMISDFSTIRDEARTAQRVATSKASEAEGFAGDAEDAADAAAESQRAAAESARHLEIDETLTMTGQAADAKQTGDKLAGIIDGLNLSYDTEQNLLYLTSDDEIISDGIHIISGSGGGGGGGADTEYTVRLVNTLPSRNISVAAGTSALLQFEYTSKDADENDDGDGVGTILVDNVRKATFNAIQGANTLNIAQYLNTGVNTVKIRVENSEGTYKSISYTVNAIALSLTTTFPEMSTQNAPVAFSYTPIGAGLKTIHFIMDGIEIGTDTVSANGRSQTFTIPAQTHGDHIFECYAELTVDGVIIISNVLRHGIVWVAQSATDVIILTTYENGTVEQGETLTIPYMVYDPVYETANVTLSVIANGETYSTKSLTGVERSEQTWIVQDYPEGTVTFRIASGNVSKDITMTVTASSIIIEPTTDSLVLVFDPSGRSNDEDTPATWSYETITGTFTGFGWSAADGWLHDSDGASVLRFLPGDTMTIPLQPFATDARETGYTIEVELATRDVRDYESIVLSCMSGDRGIQIRSQEARLASEQSGVSMLFKEDSRVRVAFSIENRNQNRLIYIYINGVMCGVTQYPTNDNFSQTNPVGFTIGAESCGIDLYKIRCYTKGLTRAEQLDNFVADRSTLAERKDAAERNNILNDNDEVSPMKLPTDLPYIVLRCAQLPQYKGDKKSGVEAEFIDRENSNRSWIANGVELDVQGTSSQYYPIKNYKIKLKQGITYTSSGQTLNGFPIHDGEIPTKVICYKADFASSENANNIVLAKFYNDIVPYDTPPQEEDSRVRQGIDGIPIALFWEDTASGTISFLGKGNCNVDKGNENIFGFSEDYPNAESWEFLNNTSSRTLFKSDDFTSMGVDEDGKRIKAWQNDFEARYPEDSLDIDSFASLVSWVKSTDRDAVNTAEEKEARLQKFADEFEDHFIKDAMIFYYIFTETFLMVDNRAKNMFMTTFDGTHWFPLPYDFDTAIGINNEGALVFDYNLEDTDLVNGSEVYNGQSSVLWNNVRDAFQTEIATMYKNLRSQNDGDPSHEAPFSYYRVAKLFTDHQSVWPEAIWNEDAFVKYLQPYLLEGKDYLGMLQGNKASQRDWWLFNAFCYRDSKYQCGDAANKTINLRCYAVGDITITPYSHIYGRVKYGSYTVSKRCTRNQSYVMECGLDNMNDTETYVYSADRIASVGDLSHLLIGQADFSAAVKLQSIKIGDEDSLFENLNLGTGSNRLSVGNNELLTSVNVANCKAFGTGDQKSLDLSGCSGLRYVTAIGTQLRGIDLPNGGHLETLRLPATITNFTILNQKDLTNLYFEGQGNIETLRVEGTPNVPIHTLVSENPNLNRVRLIGVEWTEESEASLTTVIRKLENCIGMSATGANTDHAIVNGRVSVPSISGELLAEISDNFPELVVVANNVPQYVIRFVNYDNTILYRQVVAEGGTAVNPVTAGQISAPTRPNNEDIGYQFRDFGTLPANVHGNFVLVAQYDTTYRVLFMNGETVFSTKWVLSGGNSANPGTPTKASSPQYTYTFTGWSRTDGGTVDSTAFQNVTAPRILYAVYTSAVRTFTVRFYNGSTLLQTYTNVAYGDSVAYTGTTPTNSNPDFVFIGFNPDGTNVTDDLNCMAVFKDTSSVTRAIIKRTVTSVEHDTVESTGDYAFYGCSRLTDISFPLVTSIGASAFQGCSGLTDISFPVATSISSSAFHNCSRLTDISFPLVTSIGSGAFRSCSRLTDISFPLVTSIGSDAFYGCSGLTDISFPLVTSIGASAFRDCSRLTDISFPLVTSIGAHAFQNCSGLTTLRLGNTEQVCTLANTNAFTNASNCIIYVPDALVDSYKAASNWSTYASRIKGLSELPST